LLITELDDDAAFKKAQDEEYIKRILKMTTNAANKQDEEEEQNAGKTKDDTKLDGIKKDGAKSGGDGFFACCGSRD
jgi:hypothetical protein